MSHIFLTIFAFVILIGVLVFIHELGHFLAARWTGMRAEVFAVGMGPRLFGWNRINGFTFGRLPEEIVLGENTDYRISALPIGGYVKILGMVDESMDTDFAAKEPEPWEFRSKGTLAKAFVLSAGVIMNILLAIIIFAGIKLVHGDNRWDTTTIGSLPQKGATAVAYNAGLRPGDRITAVNGREVEYFDDVIASIYGYNLDQDLTIDVDRSGSPVSVTIPRTEVPNPQTEGRLVLPDHVGIRVTSVLGADPAFKAGIKEEDVIVALDGVRVSTPEDLTAYLSTKTSGETVQVELERDGQTVSKEVVPNSEGKIGVGIETYYTGPVAQQRYGPVAALQAGVATVGEHIKMMGSMVSGLFAGKQKLKDSVGGPVKIFNIAGETFDQGWLPFFALMASLSVVLAVMNILPIPALDGGHLLFVLIEGVMRRELPMKVRMAAQQVGFVLLLAFMAFVIYNDISSL